MEKNLSVYISQFFKGLYIDYIFQIDVYDIKTLLSFSNQETEKLIEEKKTFGGSLQRTPPCRQN